MGSIQASVGSVVASGRFGRHPRPLGGRPASSGIRISYCEEIRVFKAGDLQPAAAPQKGSPFLGHHDEYISMG